MYNRRFTSLYLFHDRGDTPNGLVAKLEKVVQNCVPGAVFNKPLMPHGCESQWPTADQSFEWVKRYFAPCLLNDSLIVGIGFGGLLAAALQDAFPYKNPTVFAVNAPLYDGNVFVNSNHPQRVVLYSSLYEPIKDRCALWPQFAEAYDVAWLQHGVELSKFATGYLIGAFLKDSNLADEVAGLSSKPPGFTKQATGE